MTTILGISGSLRKGSFNTRTLEACKNLLPEGVDFEIVDIGSLPHFNEDLEANFPEEALRLKEKIQGADGIIISTPEYNRSIPGVLKNALDWTSRPYGQSAWGGKKVLLMGATVAPTGTLGAQAHLRNVLLYLDCEVFGQPETYISSAYEKWSENGNLVDESLTKHLEKAVASLVSRL